VRPARRVDHVVEIARHAREAPRHRVGRDFCSEIAGGGAGVGESREPAQVVAHLDCRSQAADVAVGRERPFD
jgi:hypothetical protein